jgi:hypothetical protein
MVDQAANGVGGTTDATDNGYMGQSRTPAMFIKKNFVGRQTSHMLRDEQLENGEKCFHFEYVIAPGCLGCLHKPELRKRSGADTVFQSRARDKKSRRKQPSRPLVRAIVRRKRVLAKELFQLHD